MAFWLQVNRRFNKIEGKHLALVISLNMFVAVIPLLIIIYAFAASFSANRSFGMLMAKDLDLTGNSALVVRDTFTNARSGESVALSISVISLLVTGQKAAGLYLGCLPLTRQRRRKDRIPRRRKPRKAHRNGTTSRTV